MLDRSLNIGRRLARISGRKFRPSQRHSQRDCDAAKIGLGSPSSAAPRNSAPLKARFLWMHRRGGWPAIHLRHCRLPIFFALSQEGLDCVRIISRLSAPDTWIVLAKRCSGPERAPPGRFEQSDQSRPLLAGIAMSSLRPSRDFMPCRAASRIFEATWVRAPVSSRETFTQTASRTVRKSAVVFLDRRSEVRVFPASPF